MLYNKLNLFFNIIINKFAENDDNNAAGAYQCTLTSVYIGGSKCECGWFVNKKIVNGTDSTNNEFTSMVGFFDVNEQKVFCGGSIIHRRYILSAAHCFIGSYSNVNDIQAKVGRNDIYADVDTIFAFTYLIESIKKHEKYVADSETQNYDIALVMTTIPITFNRGVSPACLPFKFGAG